jgi:hypothetical protein
MATMFFVQSGCNEESYRGPSIDASCKMSLHLTKQFQRRTILDIDQPKTRIAYDAMFVIGSL